MKRISIVFILLAWTLAACTPSAPVAGEPPAATAPALGETPASSGPQATEPPAAPAATAAPADTQPPAPTGGALPGALLPAPLLLLAPLEETDQIWRLEADGVSARALTAEDTTVRDFDVSPVDGRIAYVANNDLILINADGSGRSVLVDGPEAPPDNDPQGAQFLLGKPRWSPDGARLAFSLGGVNLVAASGGSPQLILQNDPLVSLPVIPTEGTPPANPLPLPIAYTYWPESWSPDGSRLLLGYSVYPESSGLAFLDPAGGTPLRVQNPEAFACCGPVWSPDSGSIYYAGPFFGMFMAGMWRASAADGTVQTLIQGDAQDGTFHMAGYVLPTADGRLYYFYAKSDTFPEGQVKLTPVTASASEAPAATPLRSDAWMVGEALWASDGSGVVIVDQEAAQAGGQPFGALLYLRSDNSPPIPLPVSGYRLMWGR